MAYITCLYWFIAGLFLAIFGGCLITDGFILSGLVTVDGIPQKAFSFNHWVQHPRTRYQSHLILTRLQKILSVKTTDVKEILLLLRDQFNRLVCRQYYYTVKYEMLFQILTRICLSPTKVSQQSSHPSTSTCYID